MWSFYQMLLRHHLWWQLALLVADFLLSVAAHVALPLAQCVRPNRMLQNRGASFSGEARLPGERSGLSLDAFFSQELALRKTASADQLHALSCPLAVLSTSSLLAAYRVLHLGPGKQTNQEETRVLAGHHAGRGTEDLVMEMFSAVNPRWPADPPLDQPKVLLIFSEVTPGSQADSSLGSCVKL